MSPVAHFLTGWAVANSIPLSRRERGLVTLSALAPDIDGLGIVPELLTRNTSQPLLWFSDYHHHLHTLTFSLLVSLVVFALATSPWRTALLALLAFHLHLLEDIAGSRGADGMWYVPYFRPFSAAQWAWSGQWTLNGWQNYLVTLALLALAFYIVWKQRRSPVEMVSLRADAAIVAAVRARALRAVQRM